MNYGHYTYRVIWSDEDQGYVGLCAEFPSLSHLDESKETARDGIVELVKQVVVDMANSGETPPVPFSDCPYR